MTRSGLILWRGPSVFTGEDVAVVATFGSDNVKTGDMVQVWILPAIENPVDAVYAGRDASVCGSCKFRSGGGCYVNVSRGPLAVWKKFVRGGYADWDGDFLVFAGLKVRFGAYGEPVAIPLDIVEGIVAASEGHTGYTHAWREFPEYAPYLMASADSEAERRQARLRGWRTFRVKTVVGGRQVGEVVCPASREAGHKATCERCMVCDGVASGRKRDVVIDAHGPRQRRVELALIK